MESTTPTDNSPGFKNIDNLPNGSLLQISYGRMQKLRKKGPPEKRKKNATSQGKNTESSKY